MAPLMAFPDVVLIDRKNGQKSGTTHIHYELVNDGFHRPVLYERINNEPWKRIFPLNLPRVISSPGDNPDFEGVFTQSLKPGQVYEVVMYFDTQDVDPNVVDPKDAIREQKPYASVMVVALLKDPEKTNLIVSHDQNVGGTWFRKVVMTTVPTFFMLYASKLPPFSDEQGDKRFLKPLAASFGGLNTHHDLQVEPLLPGNDLFYLMRVFDEDGNWQIVSDPFRTKQRKVTIDFKELHIINDGVPGNTTAEFRIWVMEGDIAVKDYFFGDVENFEISDSPDKGDEDQEFIQLASICPTFILGPKDITEEIHNVGILTRGLIERNVGDNEWAANFYFGNFPNPKSNVPHFAKFRFPVGGGENVQNVPLVLRTLSQVEGVEFEYDVTVLFTVEYM